MVSGEKTPTPANVRRRCVLDAEGRQRLTNIAELYFIYYDAWHEQGNSLNK